MPPPRSSPIISPALLFFKRNDIGSSISCSNKVEACGDDPDVGYSANHVPEASIPLDEQYDAELISGDDTDVIGDKNLSVNCTLYLGE